MTRIDIIGCASIVIAFIIAIVAITAESCARTATQQRIASACLAAGGVLVNDGCFRIGERIPGWGGGQ